MSVTETTPMGFPFRSTTGAPVISCSVRKTASSDSVMSSRTMRTSRFITSAAVPVFMTPPWLALQSISLLAGKVHSSAAPATASAPAPRAAASQPSNAMRQTHLTFVTQCVIFWL